MSKVIDLFMQYIQIDTQSDDASTTFPSTEKQKDLAKLLLQQLKDLGLEDARMDAKYGYVYATIPATISNADPLPSIGYIAHMDTSPAVSGANIKARIINNYDGKDLLLNPKEQITLKTTDFPEIRTYMGKDLIVTDGTTLLGADDKAGIAEIMAMAHYFMEHPEIPHGKIPIAFTPDEEVGQGVDHFDVPGFGADYAYTVDGGAIGELEYENFNAASATLTVTGRSVHPGSAKNKMLNAILLAQEFQALLPYTQNPAYTEMYEGFYHPDSFNGHVELTKVEYIIRDHDLSKFEEKKLHFQRCCDFLNDKYGEILFTGAIKDSYYNMKEKILPHMHLIEHAKTAMEQLDITPVIVPIRGGTDGARLSFMNLPCPNLCTGGHNFHGRYEYICIQSMEDIVKLLIEIQKVADNI